MTDNNPSQRTLLLPLVLRRSAPSLLRVPGSAPLLEVRIHLDRTAKSPTSMQTLPAPALPSYAHLRAFLQSELCAILQHKRFASGSVGGELKEGGVVMFLETDRVRQGEVEKEEWVVLGKEAKEGRRKKYEAWYAEVMRAGTLGRYRIVVEVEMAE